MLGHFSSLLVALGFCCSAALAADPFNKSGFDVGTYGGPLYEPRYCDPSGHLPMSACVMANLSMAEDFLLRAIEARYGSNGFSENRNAIQLKARQPCDLERAKAVKRYRAGDLVDIVYWSCLRQEYHSAALNLIK